MLKKGESSITLTIIGALLVLNALFLLVVSNFNLGVVLVLMLGACLGVYGLYFKKINQKCKTGVFKWIKYAVILCALIYIGTMMFLAGYGLNDNTNYTEQAVIVLGAGVHGETVSKVLAQRLDAAAEYAAKNPKAVIVVSGGQGPQEDITEALAMERYLLLEGVSSERIIKEEQSSSTYENLTFSKKILDARFGKTYKVVIITNHFHIYRAMQMARAVGLDANRSHAGLAWYAVGVNYLREVLAVYKLWVFG